MGWKNSGNFRKMKAPLAMMESSQNGKVRVKPPAKNSIIRERGGEQCVPITHHIPFQLLDPNQAETRRIAATELVKFNPRAMSWWSGEAVIVQQLFPHHKKGTIPTFGPC